PTLISKRCVSRNDWYCVLHSAQSAKWSYSASISVPVNVPSRYGENNCFACGHRSSAILPVPLMASPLPFYPLQKPAAAHSLSPPVRSTPVHPQLRAHTVPVVAATLLCRVSGATSPCPAKSPAPRRSPRRTSLPDRGESAWCDMAPPASAAPLPLAAAPRGAQRCQRESRCDRSAPPASRFPRVPIHPIRPAQSKSPAPCAGTTTVYDSPPRAVRCDRSMSSNSTRRETASSRETISGRHPA